MGKKNSPNKDFPVSVQLFWRKSIWVAKAHWIVSYFCVFGFDSQWARVQNWCWRHKLTLSIVTKLIFKCRLSDLQRPLKSTGRFWSGRIKVLQYKIKLMSAFFLVSLQENAALFLLLRFCGSNLRWNRQCKHLFTPRFCVSLFLGQTVDQFFFPTKWLFMQRLLGNILKMQVSVGGLFSLLAPSPWADPGWPASLDSPARSGALAPSAPPPSALSPVQSYLTRQTDEHTSAHFTDPLYVTSCSDLSGQDCWAEKNILLLCISNSSLRRENSSSRSRCSASERFSRKLRISE